MQKKYIVIGSSAAGTAAVMTLSRLAPEAEIMWVTQEVQLPYNKCLLADLVQQVKTREQISLLPADFFTQKKNIKFLPATCVEKIDRAEKKIRVSNAEISGEEIVYDRLLLALGVRPKEMPEEIKDCINVFNAHNLTDFESIDAYIRSVRVKHVLVIGGGLTGLETASALQMQGLDVTLVEKNDRILGNLLERESSKWLQMQLENYLQIRCHVDIKKCVWEATPYGRRITGVSLSDTSFVQTDMIICALGPRPAIDLAAYAGLSTDRGILVNNFFATTDPDIFAAGDCAELENSHISTTWAEALMQGSSAAQHMVRSLSDHSVNKHDVVKKPGTGFLKSISSRFFNQKILVFGAQTKNSRIIDTGHDSVGYIFVSNEKIVGCVLLGNYSEAFSAQVKKLVREAAPVTMIESLCQVTYCGQKADQFL